jgi:hypothetical protein
VAGVTAASVGRAVGVAKPALATASLCVPYTQLAVACCVYGLRAVLSHVPKRLGMVVIHYSSTSRRAAFCDHHFQTVPLQIKA